MKINFTNHVFPNQGVLFLGVYIDNNLTNTAQKFDKLHNNILSKSIQNTHFTGKVNSHFRVQINEDLTVILIGLGKNSEINFQKIGANIVTVSMQYRYKAINIGGNDNPKEMANLAEGLKLRAWSFDKYKTKKDEDSSDVFPDVTINTSDVEQTEKYFFNLNAGVEGNHLTRHVVSEPPNVLYPETMAKIATEELSPLGVKVEILEPKAMAKLGMNALLGVGQGSVKESRLVVMQWHGGDKNQAPIAIVGKGVTFDSGGISIKPSSGMEDMKYDMAGAGVVLGLMKTLALRKAKVNVVGVMGLVENMPSGSAQRPADVVKSMSGQTIEVVNTDAEGRLVLADALWYTQDRFQPQAMIDLATLTGAITVALGYEYAGLFSNNGELAEKVTAAGKLVDEPVWRLPLGDHYDKDINSDIADMKNVGSGRGAGSITAAQFLQRFVNNVPWAHLDIAGMAWDKKNKPLSGKGATGYGVRLLNSFLMQNYE